MSSASLVEKRSKKQSHSRNIQSSSTSITSAPPTASDQHHSKPIVSSNRTKEKVHRLKQRESLPEINLKKSSKNVRGSNYELSSSGINGNDDYVPSTIKSNKLGKSTTNLENIESTKSEKCADRILEQLRLDLSQEEKNRKQAEREYNDLKRQYEEMQSLIEQERQNPTSEYDKSISKQQYFNETLKSQIAEAKETLKNLSQSLKTLRTCGKDCNIHMRDLIIDYNCITKGELSKEIKRFQRMEIDLKNNLDRLHWRMDCESKMYHNLIDQYHKLQMDFYYLKNLNDSTHSTKHMYLS